jgi:hypothetical protein
MTQMDYSVAGSRKSPIYSAISIRSVGGSSIITRSHCFGSSPPIDYPSGLAKWFCIAESITHIVDCRNT